MLVGVAGSAQYERHQDGSSPPTTLTDSSGPLIPDSSDLVSIFVHANKMHVQHCKRVVQSVEEVVRTAEIEVSQSVCNVLFGVNPEY